MSYDFFAAMLVGFLGGGHCLGLCGGIVGAFSTNIPPHHRLAIRHRIPYLISYNIGRIVSYCIAGALIGISMQFFALKSHLVVHVLSLMAGLMLILLGLYLGQWFNGLTKIEIVGKFAWRYIAPLAKKFIPFKHPISALPFGMIWGWLPCGLVYSTLTWSAASASPVSGAFIMLGFGLGTLPAMLAMGIFAQQLSKLLKHIAFRTIAAALILMYGINMVVSAINLI